MATENWQVVGDIDCSAWLQPALHPQINSSQASEFGNHFLMDSHAIIRRCRHPQPNDEDDDLGLFLDDDNWSVDEHEDRIPVQFNSDDPHDMATALSRILSYPLQVPLNAHRDILHKIIPKASKAAREHSVLHVSIDVYVVNWNSGIDSVRAMDVDGISDYEPAFVPASKASIENLERTRVKVLSTCSVCMEDVEVGEEATRMPCSHLYHEACIVEWLKKSRVCPLCRHSLI